MTRRGRVPYDAAGEDADRRDRRLLPTWWPLWSRPSTPISRLRCDRVANGWDNVIFRLGDGSRRPPAAARRRRHPDRERAALARRAGPAAARAGPGSGADRCSERGVPVALVDHAVVRRPPPGPSASADRRPYARVLGRFLARLHTPAAPDAPRNPVRGIPLAGRSEALSRHLETVPLDRPEVLRRHWDRLVDTPAWSGPPLWLHGDPHPGNVLVHDGHGLGGRSTSVT